MFPFLEQVDANQSCRSEQRSQLVVSLLPAPDASKQQQYHILQVYLVCVNLAQASTVLWLSEKNLSASARRAEDVSRSLRL